MLKSHTLVPEWSYTRIGYELRPARDPSGRPVDGLYNAWIVLNNPTQFNSYTTDMVKEVILAFRQASMDRRIVAVVFTAVGDKAFCTGGNTREYAQYYAGNPQEYKQYMRLFNDMIDSILRCDKPVGVCSVVRVLYVWCAYVLGWGLYWGFWWGLMVTNRWWAAAATTAAAAGMGKR